jgi:hypothetical protein
MLEETTTDSREQAAAVRVYLSRQLWEKLDNITERILRIEVCQMGIKEQLQRLEKPEAGSLPRYMKPLLDAQQVADCLGVSPKTINKWARWGFIQAVNLPGGVGRRRRDGTGSSQYRFKSDDIEEFVNSQLSGRKLSRRLMKSL